MQDLEFGLGIGPHAKTIQQHSSPMNILIAGKNIFYNPTT